jgi:hypothetical protein
MPTEKEIFDSKGPVEADKNDTAAIDARNKTRKTGRTRTSQKAAPVKGPTPTWDPSTVILFLPPRAPVVDVGTYFHFEALQRARHCSGTRRHLQQRIVRPSHLCHTQSRVPPLRRLLRLPTLLLRTSSTVAQQLNMRPQPLDKALVLQPEDCL